ncbi:molybdopterin-guanine dinucleotide biosynthesis protein B [ANME-1 cluster archaeon GoMg4]|nr:molybdopterin-guanine dinucleotide biosynthesis protein B [ANME-1 cluster archaeon GoMg4]
MKNIIGICGYHNSGKTTLVEKLIRRLKKDGYRIATIKNIPKKFSIDTEGKDTWRHREAGAGVVVASSPDETAFIFKRGMELKEMADILNKVASPDLILVEGRKMEKIPKVAVGEIELEDAIKYEDNLDEILSWVKELHLFTAENAESAEMTKKD